MAICEEGDSNDGIRQLSEISNGKQFSSKTSGREIIRILNYGWLRNPYSYLYIDMELWDVNLHTYVHGERPDFKLDDWQEIYVPKDASLMIRFRNTLIIMKQISDGLKFIHDKGHVHRDLKPRNGTFTEFGFNLIRLVLFSLAEIMWKIAISSEATSQNPRTTTSAAC